MTKLAWGMAGERIYEAGTDRGVLYLDGVAGVPWNGLKSVKESPNGGDPQPYYYDGIKYLNIAKGEEFAATIEAFSAPREFGVCDGTVSVMNGLFITQQPRQSFGLSYRTKIGNELQGLELGYKIHLVYNVLAAPSSRENATISESTEPLGLSWDVTTTPPAFSGYKPSAHLVIDSRQTDPKLLDILEGFLYGSTSNDPILPTAAEVIQIFTTWTGFDDLNFKGILDPSTTEIINLATNPSMGGTSAPITIRTNLATNPNITATSGITPNNPANALAKNVAITGHPLGITTAGKSTMVAGHAAYGNTLSAYNIDSLGNTSVVARYIGAWVYSSAPGYSAYFVHETGTKTPLTVGTWTFIASLTKVPANTYAQVAVGKTDGSNVTNDADNALVTGVTVDANLPVVTSIYGGRPAADDRTYAWTGAANASTSVQQVVPVVGMTADKDWAYSSTQWAKTGTKSCRLTPNDLTTTKSTVIEGATFSGLGMWTPEPGKTYTTLATRRLSAPITGVLDTYFGHLALVQDGGPGTILSDQVAPNTPGEFDFRWTFDVDPASTATSHRLTHGGGYESGAVWWDSLCVVEGTYDGPYFGGATAPFTYRAQPVAPSWMGSVDASPSHFFFYTNLPETAVENDAYAVDGNLWVFQSGVWVKYGAMPAI